MKNKISSQKFIADYKVKVQINFAMAYSYVYIYFFQIRFYQNWDRDVLTHFDEDDLLTAQKLVYIDLLL